MPQEIMQSLQIVTSASGFFWYVGTIIAVGMIAGAKLDHNFSGLRKSLFLILPYAAILFFTTSSRLYQTALVRTLNADAYNGLMTLVLITIAYVIGLFIGHVIVSNGTEQAKKQYKAQHGRYTG